MDYINYLKTYQDIPYKVFLNAFKNNKIFHAYLLVGEKGTPLLEISKFLAASIINPSKKYFADQDDIVTQRIFDQNYVDLRVFDTKEKPVKIDDIRSLEDSFAKTGTEKESKKVYIINLVENLSLDAINALLKFLEEPLPDTYAILTTENDKRILPTILSRVQKINFSLLPQLTLIQDAIALGVSEEDAEIFSFFYNDASLIKEHSTSGKERHLIELAINALDYSSASPLLLNYLLNSVQKDIKDKQDCKTFFDLLILFFKEAIKIKYKDQTVLQKYDKILDKLVHFENIEDKVLLLMNARNEINFNLNLNLLTFDTFTKVFGL